MVGVDANQHGLARRYLFTGLRAAHDAGYPAMAAHILADLSYQATCRGEFRNAVMLGQAAQRRSVGCPPSVHASVLSRLAFSYAAAGRHDESERTHLLADDTLTGRTAESDPSWMYYLTPNHLDCQAGHSLVLTGRRALSAGDRGTGRRLLQKGEALLRTGAYARPVDDPSGRRALYEGAWLALCHTAQGRLDDACATAYLALPRLERIRSPRSVALLRRLDQDLRSRKRNPAVREFLPDLRRAPARHAA